MLFTQTTEYQLTMTSLSWSIT